MDPTGIVDKVYELLTVYGIKVIAAIVIFIVGRWVARAVANFIKKMMTRKGFLCMVGIQFSKTTNRKLTKKFEIIENAPTGI